ncbi:unnamed protein product [Parajaminaea phylloscopi]
MSTPSPRKRKPSVKADTGDGADEVAAESKVKAESPSKKPKGPAKPYTEEENRLVWLGVYTMGLQNLTEIRQVEGLKGRDAASLNHRMRGEFKKHFKSIGGDPKVIDAIKLAPAKTSS